jgi:O-antigen ligase
MRYGYASAFLFILGCGIVINKSHFKKVLNLKFFYLALSLCFFAVLAAKTRGALLGIIVGCSFMMLKFKPRLGKALVGLGSIFIAIVIFISFTGIKTDSRFFNIKDGSNKKRMSQFYTAVKSIQEKPIFGLGASQFSYHVTKLKNKYDIWSKEYSGHSHNIFLEHAANYGIPGLILFLGFLAFWGMELLKLGNFGWVILSYLVAFIAAGQVENLFDNTNSHLLFFIYPLSFIKFGEISTFKNIETKT